MTLTSRHLLYRGELYPLDGTRAYVHENPAGALFRTYTFAIATPNGAIMWQECWPKFVAGWRIRRLRDFANAINTAAKEVENFGLQKGARKMGFSPKYGKVTTEKGDIPADEPVFLVRAQDMLALELLRYYRLLCLDARTTFAHLDGIVTLSEMFRKWREDEFTQVPGGLAPTVDTPPP
jgi:hypothetical protein